MEISRGWSFTISGKTIKGVFDLKSYFTGSVIYIVAGYEYTPGNSHVQGYFRFQSRVHFSMLVKLLGDQAHIESQSGTIEQAVTECIKCGSFEEYGHRPHFQHLDSHLPKATARKRQLFNKLQEGADLHELIDSRPEHLGYILSIAKFATADRTRQVPSKVLYISGGTGIGKTFTVQQTLHNSSLNFYKKNPVDQLFDMYNFEPIIVFDNFYDYIPLHKFIALCEPDPPLLPMKGSKLPNTSTHYIILSLRRPDDQYKRLRSKQPTEWNTYRSIVTHSIEYDFEFVDSTRENKIAEIRKDIEHNVSMFVSDLILN